MSHKTPSKTVREDLPFNVTIEFIMFVNKDASEYTPIPFNAIEMAMQKFPDRIFCNTQLVPPPAPTKFVKHSPGKGRSIVLDPFQQIPLTWLIVLKLFYKVIPQYPYGLLVNIGSGVGVSTFMILFQFQIFVLTLLG